MNPNIHIAEAKQLYRVYGTMILYNTLYLPTILPIGSILFICYTYNNHTKLPLMSLHVYTLEHNVHYRYLEFNTNTLSRNSQITYLINNQYSEENRYLNSYENIHVDFMYLCCTYYCTTC